MHNYAFRLSLDAGSEYKKCCWKVSLSLIIPPVAGDHDRREVRGDGTATVRVQPAGAAGQVVGPRRGGHLQLRTEDRRLSHQTCQSPLGCGIRRGQNTQRMSS